VQRDLQKALGERIRELRMKRGYSQESFADHCGVHRTFMGTVERGESNLSLQNLARISAALEITLSRLFSGLEERVKREGQEPSNKSR
jgi:transcriptional regulator with XRE-family HTH domain